MKHKILIYFLFIIFFTSSIIICLTNSSLALIHSTNTSINIADMRTFTYYYPGALLQNGRPDTRGEGLFQTSGTNYGSMYTMSQYIKGDAPYVVAAGEPGMKGRSAFVSGTFVDWDGTKYEFKNVPIYYGDVGEAVGSGHTDLAVVDMRGNINQTDGNRNIMDTMEGSNKYVVTESKNGETTFKKIGSVAPLCSYYTDPTLKADCEKKLKEYENAGQSTQCNNSATPEQQTACEQQQCAAKPTQAERQACEQQQAPTQPTPPPRPPQQPTQPSTPPASSSGSGGWDSRDRYCHKYQGSAGPKGIYENVASCNAGFLCINYECNDGNICCQCSKVNDCGINGATCNSAVNVTAQNQCQLVGSCSDSGQCSEAGCLNYICKRGQNAIWDMGTKKCGCDDGHGMGGGGSSGSGNQSSGSSGSNNSAGGSSGSNNNPASGSTGNNNPTGGSSGSNNSSNSGTTGSGGQGVGTGSQNIYDKASRAENEQVCTTGLAHSCANTVSGIMGRTGIPFTKTNSTSELYTYLNANPDWEQVPIANANKGDIIVSPTDGINFGHSGIVAASGATQIFTSSRGGPLMNNYSAQKWDKIFTPRGLPTYVFRYKK